MAKQVFIPVSPHDFDHGEEVVMRGQRFRVRSALEGELNLEPITESRWRVACDTVRGWLWRAKMRVVRKRK
jgi:hypothetical protein